MADRIRPLRRVGRGVWRSRDENWTFMRHESDPSPKRWFVYEGDDRDPANEGSGIITLADAVRWVEA